VIPEAPFLFSIAALSASLAGLAGLVVGLRRGSDLRAIDMFRLREIVEFAFANIILSIAIVPLTVVTGSIETVVRFAALAALVYAVATSAFLAATTRRLGIAWTWGWGSGAIAINVGILVASLATMATGSIGMYEALLVVLLIRPMFAFVLVIASLGESRND
jgi:hypothetical protein